MAANQRQQRNDSRIRSSREGHRTRSGYPRDSRRSNRSRADRGRAEEVPRRRRRPQQKVRAYRRPMHINTGLVIFGIIFVYMLVCIYAHLTSTHISPYEVQAGSIVVDNSCRGLILREEEIVYAEESGYVNYYVRAGEKVSGSSNVYTLDQNGQAMSVLTADLEGGVLDSDSLSRLRTNIEAYEAEITPMGFDSVYDFKTKIENSVLSMVNEQLLSDAGSLEDDDTAGMFHFIKAKTPGIIEYYTDGYEEVTSDSFAVDMLDDTAYEKRDLASVEIVNAGDPVYKLVTDENWTILIPLDEEKLEELADKNSISIRFKKNGLETTASFEIMRRDGQAYGVLGLSNYMVEFAEDRYVDLELQLSKIEGLKIPVSAITEKQFYTIPLNFQTTGGDDDSPGFLVETYLEDGSPSVKFVATTIYETTDEVCYVDCADFDLGAYIVKEDSAEERYQIGTTASLKGVYNINRGYAVFRKVNILYESEEYCIVEQGTDYGLSIYDHIVLDSKAVQEEEIVY